MDSVFILASSSSENVVIGSYSSSLLKGKFLEMLMKLRLSLWFSEKVFLLFSQAGNGMAAQRKLRSHDPLSVVLFLLFFVSSACSVTNTLYASLIHFYLFITWALVFSLCNYKFHQDRSKCASSFNILPDIWWNLSSKDWVFLQLRVKFSSIISFMNVCFDLSLKSHYVYLRQVLSNRNTIWATKVI